ncbi:MAG: Do family serine endopeptidase [bacterium]|nr:Do family serine endopeptidase [bacterium]
MTQENTNNRLQRFFALALLAVTFTILGILLASRLEWTADSKAQQSTPSATETLKSSGLLTDQGESPFVAVAQKVRPSVVNITAKKTETGGGNSQFDWGPFRDFFPPGVHPQIPRGVTSGGSGIIIDKDGLILTNNHVVADASEISVKAFNGHEYRADVVGRDPDSDVALIRVKDSKFTEDQVAELGDSDAIKVGDWAIAIGNPFGMDWTVTVGVISAKGRSNLAIAGGGPSYQSFIQTDASINPGNSGGPLINIHGQVIGVNTAINMQGQGMGYAIPANLAKEILDQLRKDGQVVRGYLGMVPRELDDATREALKVDRDVKGVFVDGVEKGTPADKGGLEAGDVITQVDEQPIDDPSKFRFMIAEHKPGSNVTLKVLRNGDEKNMSFTLGDRSEHLPVANAPSTQKEQNWLGLHIESLDSPSARQLNLDATEGVLVVEVDYSSPAEGKILPQDVIVEINRTPVKTVAGYGKIMSQIGDKKDAILFRILRNGRLTFEAVKP